jgi:hypothetical protein
VDTICCLFLVELLSLSLPAPLFFLFLLLALFFDGCQRSISNLSSSPVVCLRGLTQLHPSRTLGCNQSNQKTTKRGYSVSPPDQRDLICQDQRVLFGPLALSAISYHGMLQEKFDVKVKVWTRGYMLNGIR